MQTLTKEARADLVDTAFYTLSTLTEPADRPTLTIVLGQTGTPTALVQREIEEQRRPQGGAVLVSGYDMDRLAAGEGYAADLIDSERLTVELVQRAMAAKVNVVVTPSPTKEDMPLALIAEAKRQGYEVEIAALAVNPKIAVAQSFQRSALFPAPSFLARRDTVLARETANVGKVLRRIEANDIDAHITLYDRHGQAMERNPHQTASEAFESTRGAMSGAEKIRLAAAWEEVAEAYERSGHALPENGQRMREQAHYILRQSPAASLNFDDRFPENMGVSKSMAERYGNTLAKLFDAGDKAAVAEYPELTNAFVNKNLAIRLSFQQRNSEISTLADRRIHQALLDGTPIKVPEIRAEVEASKDRSFEVER